MKRILLFLLLFSSAASAQISPYWGVSRVNTKGYWNLRLRSDSALHLPRKYALELNDNDTTPQIFVKGNELIYFSAGNYYPVSGGSSIDTNYWNSKIYSRLLISDTINAFGGRFLTGIGGIAAGGDLSGNYPNPTVAYFNGQPPSYYLNYNNLSNKPTYVSNIERTEGKDSIIFWIGGNRYAIKDSTGAGIASINGLTGSTQTFATGTSGTNFNVVSSGNTHTFNIPDASAYNRGLITTGDQVISGNKTFGGSIRVEYFYIGSLSGASSTDSLLTINYSTGEVKRRSSSYYLTQSDIAPATLTGGISSYTIPSGKLVSKVVIIEPTSINVNIGTSVGGSQIASGVPVTTGKAVFTFEYYTTSSTTLYFSNLTGGSTVKIYYQ